MIGNFCDFFFQIGNGTNNGSTGSLISLNMLMHICLLNEYLYPSGHDVNNEQVLLKASTQSI